MHRNENILFIALFMYLSNDSKQDIFFFFFGKYENTSKSMEFAEGGN